jgi:deoxyribonuclease V
VTVEEALAEQERLRAYLDLTDPGPAFPRALAGLDVAYHEDGHRLAAAVVVLDATTLEVLDTAITTGKPAFDYVPGLFAFREVPALLDALAKLTVQPDVLICDGHGLAHPRRFGLACHLGVLTGLPSFGVGKTPLVGTWDEPGPNRGDWSPLVAGGEDWGNAEAARETVGRVVRTRPGVKPVFVSVGHRVSLERATEMTVALTPRFRLPETTRAADQACRRGLAGATGGG